MLAGGRPRRRGWRLIGLRSLRFKAGGVADVHGFARQRFWLGDNGGRRTRTGKDAGAIARLQRFSLTGTAAPAGELVLPCSNRFGSQEQL